MQFDDIMDALRALDEEARKQFGRDLPLGRKQPVRSPDQRCSSGDGPGHMPN